MRWELWSYGLAQLIVTALLFAEMPSDVEIRAWTTRAIDYGLYVVFLTVLYRQFKLTTGEVTKRRMVQFGIYSSVVLGVKYVGSWFYMEKTIISIATVGAACLSALWFFVVIGLVSLLWYGAMSAFQMAREQGKNVR